MQQFLLENKEGERMAIMTTSTAPEVGILVLVDREEHTGPFFVLPDGKKFPIVRLEQPPELCGIDEPPGLSEMDRWHTPYKETFCTSLTHALEKSNVTYLGLAADNNTISRWEQYAQRVKTPIKNISEDILSD